MDLICRSIFTLLAIYILYSECITLPQVIKKNKKLLYFLIGGMYLYTFDSAEGWGATDTTVLVALVVVSLVICYILGSWAEKKGDTSRWSLFWITIKFFIDDFILPPFKILVDWVKSLMKSLME